MSGHARWTFDKDEGDWLVMDDDFYTVCVVHDEAGQESEKKARLIAAAPELLETLVSAVNAIEQGGLGDLMCCDGRDCGCRASTNGDLLAHDLRAVIAKTTGGAE